MEFKSKEHLLDFLSNLEDCGFGSQGVCYYNSYDNNVYKIYHQFFDDIMDEDFIVKYKQEDILRFSDINNDTFIWPNDVVRVKDEVVGYKSKFVNARPLYKINPLMINLDKFEKSIELSRKDIDIISDRNVLIFDVMYNILYGNKFYVVDQDEYTFTDGNNAKLKDYNKANFDIELYYFLVDGIFQKFVDDNKVLKEMYDGKEAGVLEFLKLFRKSLSENVGRDIVRLSDAMSCVDNEQGTTRYQRILI